MNKFLKVAALGVAVLALPVSASAGIYNIDFKAAANTNERAIPNGAPGETIGGLAMTFEAYYDGNTAWAYLDHGAGLGVCGELPAGSDGDKYYNVATGGDNWAKDNECKDAGDDNIQAKEEVTIHFENDTLVNGLLFNAEGHAALDGDVTVVINDIAMLASIAMAMDFYGDSIKFSFGGDAFDQYYVSAMTAAVPAPAALGLLGFGLAGLGGLARRRRS